MQLIKFGYLGRGFSGSNTSTAVWILATNYWNDYGIWIDTEYWQD